MSTLRAATRDGIRRWQSWLTVRLQPDPVEFHGISLEPPHEVRWRIHFRSGPARFLAIPGYLVRSEPAVIEHVTLGLDSYDWPLLMKRSETAEFRLNQNGMLAGVIDPVGRERTY